MTSSWLRPAFFVGLFLSFLAIDLRGVQCEEELESIPPEDLCRPYIEKALKDLGTGSLEQTSAEADNVNDEEGREEEGSAISEEADQSKEDKDVDRLEDETDDTEETEDSSGKTDEVGIEETEDADILEEAEDKSIKVSDEDDQTDEIIDEDTKGDKSEEKDDVVGEGEGEGEEEESVEPREEDRSEEKTAIEEEEQRSAEVEATRSDDDDSIEAAVTKSSEEAHAKSDDDIDEEEVHRTGDGTASSLGENENEGKEDNDDKVELGGGEEEEERTDDQEAVDAKEEGSLENEKSDEVETRDETEIGELSKEASEEASETPDDDISESDKDTGDYEGKAQSVDEEETASEEEGGKEMDESTLETTIISDEETLEKEEEKSTKRQEEEGQGEGEEGGTKEKEETVSSRTRREAYDESEEKRSLEDKSEEDKSEEDKEVESEEEPSPEEDLIREIQVPENLRPRDHINQLLKLDEENEEKERAIQKVSDVVLRDLKKLYDNAIQPLETLYKYRDLSNRHFGDPEIFSKPLVLFMGPWSGGKSSIINYLLDIEYTSIALRTGAEPSPAYFNILMYGEEEEVLDGTQLAADWTFSGLQKFGQGMLDRLRGLRFDNKLLEKVNIVEIPGILEIRKQVQRLFPFNDACQWFIDRADIIFLVYDPSKLDVGPETEAILDQLKGREYQTRIILNKADQVKPEELMRVQGALIWNISPLMSSAEPPIMYSTSLWSLPYETGAPTRLLYAQERAFLRDLRSAIDKRVEHKIASARRFAVRVRNHAKMVDCYLTTYYNHKTFFGNKKEISDKIVENPQDYHIYEGLSTLTNISRYDLPDPDVYRDFFRLNPLYDFQLLSSTCTYFRGCPINRLDVAIAYDLPELVGKYKKSVEVVMHENEASSPSS
ncbi:eukaryotic translation initiation factor 5B [Vespa crabro]|uniref:eukaryotic translation initiation factor 5B n=1 Tax=Vespa crabro TaxID=7445 RepID=UPI001F00B4C7|nr:eukaryotic translation initiation factor 5B [Vespa crabro]